MSNAKSEEDRILLRMEMLLSSFHERDFTHDFKSVADYYKFLGDRIDYENLHIDSAQPLLEMFESVFLWLKDSLLQYPESIRQQVLKIVQEKQLCEIISIIANLSDAHLRRLRYKGILGGLLKWYSILGFSFVLPPEEREYLSPAKLFDAKLGLKRLSQIVHFASTIDVADYDETFRDFRNNYDPNLIDKSKLIAFTNILRVQLNETPDSEHKKLILHRLDAIESEIKKSKVRWGIVITGIFALYGFFADIETLHPGSFEKATQTVYAILDVLHKDGGVQKSRQRTHKPLPVGDDEGHGVPPMQTGLLSAEARIRENEEGDDE